MKLFVQFNESETKHLQTLEAGQSFGSNTDGLELKVFAMGETTLRVVISAREELIRNTQFHLSCDIPSGEVKANENILLSAK